MQVERIIERQPHTPNGHGAPKRLQDTFHLPDELPWRIRAREGLRHAGLALLPSPEALDVAGRAVKGFVVPHWAAGVLLAAMLGSMGFMYSRLSDQRDMLIRLDTQLQERNSHELEYRNEFKTKLHVQQLQIEQINKEAAVIKQMLTPEQRAALDKTPKDEN